MKRILAVVALLPALAFAQTIANTDHDLGTGSGKGSTQICIYCHTPHNALTNPDRLWNRNTSGATYSVYSSTTMNNAVGQPGADSDRCLSCHDGTIAYGAYIKTWSGRGANNTDVMASNAAGFIGTDLSNDHPINVSVTGNPDIATAAAITTGGLTLYGAGNVYVECMSCHKIHQWVASTPYLRKDNARSALCLTCHLK